MIIVLGASGFVGMYTVERLIADGKKVLATGRNERMKAALEEMGGPVFRPWILHARRTLNGCRKRE